MTTPKDSMSGREFRQAVEQLGFAESGKANDAGISAAARFLGMTPRAGMNLADKGANKATAKLLRLMLALKLSPADVDAAIARRRRR